jgi:hypothetical protein
VVPPIRNARFVDLIRACSSGRRVSWGADVERSLRLIRAEVFRRWCLSLNFGDLVEWTAIRDNRMAVQFTPTKGISACPSGTTLSTVSNKTWLNVEGKGSLRLSSLGAKIQSQATTGPAGGAAASPSGSDVTLWRPRDLSEKCPQIAGCSCRRGDRVAMAFARV